MRPVVAVVGPILASVANNIALSQTPGAAGALLINGSLAVNGTAYLGSTPGAAQRVLITTADTTHIFTVTGTTPTGAVITETVGPITASQYTTQDFYTVTSILINGAATAAVTVGTSGIAATPWVRCDEWASEEVSIQCNAVGTVNYTVQATNDDPNSPTNPVLPQNVTWINSPDTNAVAATTSIRTGYGELLAYAALTPLFVRTLLNSGTGSVSMTVVQPGVVGV
jgi:hypothetical protein